MFGQEADRQAAWTEQLEKVTEEAREMIQDPIGQANLKMQRSAHFKRTAKLAKDLVDSITEVTRDLDSDDVQLAQDRLIVTYNLARELQDLTNVNA